ncbi:hypothetical protein K474DRAFT_1668920 [Panus rudis PR-1116 ss-1]|nr:hypothetical protein K474DRAFT_1668920 [Panus rudis PR-1116 ss-1]
MLPRSLMRRFSLGASSSHDAIMSSALMLKVYFDLRTLSSLWSPSLLRSRSVYTVCIMSSSLRDCTLCSKKLASARDVRVHVLTSMKHHKKALALARQNHEIIEDDLDELQLEAICYRCKTLQPNPTKLVAHFMDAHSVHIPRCPVCSVGYDLHESVVVVSTQKPWSGPPIWG